MASLSGKVVLITGGAGGFGKAFVEKFLSLGCKVCICDINCEAGNKAVESFASQFGDETVKFAHCDVTKDESFKGAFTACKESFGGVDILVNNAGIGNEKDFKLNLDVNLGGVIRGTEFAIEHMSKAKGHEGGRVINVASIAGLKELPFGPFYAASKSGIIHYTRTIGHPFHLNYSGVVVQCLCPSLVNTPFIQVTPNKIYNPQCEAALKSLFGKVPLLESSDVVDALMKLIEDNKPGGVLTVEKGKDPYYVDAAITS